MSTAITSELLELAAKAAGERGRIVARRHGGSPEVALERADGTFWIPHLDDGDALRLAARLQMDICIYEDGTEVLSVCQAPVQESADDGEVAVAVRRAVFRAAVEVGRAMP